MHLAIILAIVAAYGIAEYAPHETLALGGIWHAISAAVVMTAVALFATVTSKTTARRMRRAPSQRERLLQRFELWKKAHAVAWLVGAAVVLIVCRWPQLVRFEWHLEGWILLDDLLLLAPVVVPLLWVWAWQTDVELALHAAEVNDSETEQTPAFGEPGGSIRRARERRPRWSRMWLYARHYLLLPLVPVLCLVLVHDLADWLMPNWQTANWAWAVYVLPLMLLALALPWLLRWFFLATPLPPGELRQRLEAAARRAGVAVRDILVWNTGGRARNAAAVGFVPPLRYVFLTDALLERLAPDEVVAVFLHEAAHLRRRHLLVRLAAMCLPVALFLAVHAALGSPLEPAAAAVTPLGVSAAEPGIDFEPGAIMLSAACVVGVLLALRQSSRICEHDADLWASRWMTAAKAVHVPDASGTASMIAALEQLEADRPKSRNRVTWLHPNVRERIDFLRRAAHQPDYARHFSLRLRWISCLVGAILTALVTIALVLA